MSVQPGLTGVIVFGPNVRAAANEENRVLQALDDLEAEEAAHAASLKNRLVWGDDEKLKILTDFDGSQMTQGEFCEAYNKLHPKKKLAPDNLKRWIAIRKKEGAVVNQVRGRPLMLQPREFRHLLSVFDRMRNNSSRVTARQFASLARGALVRFRQQDLAETAGVRGILKFTRPWARYTMKSLGIGIRRRTGDRTVTAQQIVAQGRDFFAKVG